MKIKIENIIKSEGPFCKTPIYATLYKNIIEGILSVTWADQHEFIINPIAKGNGVLPIKNNFLAHLLRNNWKAEVTISLINGLNPGPIDAIYECEEGLVAVEWETGNISSSHRAMNKIALGIIQKKLIAGFLVLPMRSLSKFLTDRIGNYEELSPYFQLYSHLEFDNGIIGVIGVEYDKLSQNVVLIPKGKDGNSKKLKQI